MVTGTASSTRTSSRNASRHKALSRRSLLPNTLYTARVLVPASLERTVADDPQAIVAGRAQGYFLTEHKTLHNSFSIDARYKLPGG